MAFLSGSATNSYELTNIIHATLRDVGWDLVSGLSDSGNDSVFHSSGSDGYQDIIIRVAANQADRIAVGDIQFPYNDGYNGYINAFAYQSFSGSTGIGEIGRLGPTLYLQDGNISSFVLQAYNMFRGAGDAYGTSIDSVGVSYSVSDDISYGVEGDHANTVFNGQGKMYAKRASSSYLMEFDMTSPSNWTPIVSDHFDFCDGPSIWSRKDSLTPMVWSLLQGATSGLGGWSTYNTLTGSSVTGTDTGKIYPKPPWGTASAGLGAFIAQGVRRDRNKHIYVGRGRDTDTWARYNMDTNLWTSMSPSLPATQSGGGCVYIMKEISGYTYDRLYIVRGNGTSTWWSISIDDNGNPNPDLVGWIAHASLPVIWSGVTPSLFFHAGGKYIYASDDGSSALYRWEFPVSATDAGAWETVSDDWMHQNLSVSADPVFFMNNHLSSKVEVDEYLLTPYWIFADQDRLIVVTKSLQSDYNNKYNMFYAGLFDSNIDDGSGSTLSEDAGAGDTILHVNDVGSFKVGSTYKMLDPNTYITITGFDGYERYSSLGQQIVITNISQLKSTITIENPLASVFSKGATIGRDIQPVCVSGGNMDYIIVTNFIDADGYLANNYPFQFYDLIYPVQSIQTLSERIAGVTAWPVILSHSAIQDQRNGSYITQKESRGSLIGVYYVSGISNEGSVQINNRRYMVFSIKDSNKLASIAIGPME